MPTAEVLAAHPHEELAEAYRLIGELSERVERLERQRVKDSGTSSKPPSSDSPSTCHSSSYRLITSAGGITEAGRLVTYPFSPASFLARASDFSSRARPRRRS